MKNPGLYEIMDRVSIIASNWDKFVENHPDIPADQMMHAEIIGEHLGNFYQIIATRFHEGEE